MIIVDTDNEEKDALTFIKTEKYDYYIKKNDNLKYTDFTKLYGYDLTHYTIAFDDNDYNNIVKFKYKIFRKHFYDSKYNITLNDFAFNNNIVNKYYKCNFNYKANKYFLFKEFDLQNILSYILTPDIEKFPNLVMKNCKKLNLSGRVCCCCKNNIITEHLVIVNKTDCYLCVVCNKIYNYKKMGYQFKRVDSYDLNNSEISRNININKTLIALNINNKINIPYIIYQLHFNNPADIDTIITVDCLP